MPSHSLIELEGFFGDCSQVTANPELESKRFVWINIIGAAMYVIAASRGGWVTVPTKNGS